MKTFILIRHAKSSWQDAHLVKDIDRSLKDRGIIDAIDMASRLEQKQIAPQKIVSSDGIRALHTAIIFARKLHVKCDKIEIDSSLFHCNVSDIESVIHSQNSNVNTLAVFCHNPSINEFASKYIPYFYENVPTCGVLCFSSEIENWSDFSSKNTNLLWFDYPKNSI
ncbi:MAG: histidine phosphatase family protein [Bacteroidetes bacterium]|nr:histidine phosphatase family protein [Bacteroidota bacterium]MCB9226393.1 histidine phosphatase family protein [Chitinophagales bacterium]